MPYDLIDKIIEKQRADREAKRIKTLSEMKEILADLSLKYDFSKAYIFGSLVKKGRFGSESDADIAVFDLDNEYFFSMMAEISRLLGRNVDLYQIENINEHLRKRIEETGMLWMQEG